MKNELMIWILLYDNIIIIKEINQYFNFISFLKLYKLLLIYLNNV